MIQLDIRSRIFVRLPVLLVIWLHPKTSDSATLVRTWGGTPNLFLVPGDIYFRYAPGCNATRSAYLSRVLNYLGFSRAMSWSSFWFSGKLTSVLHFSTFYPCRSLSCWRRVFWKTSPFWITPVLLLYRCFRSYLAQSPGNDLLYPFFGSIWSATSLRSTCASGQYFTWQQFAPHSRSPLSSRCASSSLWCYQSGTSTTISPVCITAGLCSCLWGHSCTPKSSHHAPLLSKWQRAMPSPPTGLFLCRAKTRSSECFIASVETFPIVV